MLRRWEARPGICPHHECGRIKVLHCQEQQVVLNSVYHRGDGKKPGASPVHVGQDWQRFLRLQLWHTAVAHARNGLGRDREDAGERTMHNAQTNYNYSLQFI